MLRDVLVRHNIVQDTVVLLNDEMKKGKRVLVEDCSSTQMDVDLGIYPYTDSFYTTTGAVCTGLGVPEESLETTIGALSAVTLLNNSFHKRIKQFPTEIFEDTDKAAFDSIQEKLRTRYNIEDMIFGWPDLNLVKHAERINRLSSLFITHIDLFDDLDEIKVCTGYERKYMDNGVEKIV